MDKEELIKKASEAYYNSDSPIMSDAEYDALAGELDETKVGAEITGNIDRIQIQGKAMKSLEKVYSAEDIRNKIGGNVLFASVKCDGISTRLIYENGKLISANTRGNGTEGGDITEHIKYFLNVPLTIEKKERYIIDGESIIYLNDFNTIQNKYNLKNPRNTVAGALSTKDTSFVKNYKLSFIVWNVIEGGENEWHWNMSDCAKMGFDVVPSIAAFNDDFDYVNNIIFQDAENSSIPCDGVVWRIDNNSIGETYGETVHHFKDAVAFKRANIGTDTELLDIEWTMGRTGVLTPVAIYKEVDIDGSTCSRASLHNIDVMYDILHIPFKNQKIQIVKKNEIIPQVIWAEEICEGGDIDIPETCPICGKATTIDTSDSGVRNLICTNPNCDGKLINKIDHFCSKKGLDIKGLSKMTLEKLIDWKYINSVKDIFTLNSHRNEWIHQPGFGVASVDKILKAIEGSKNNCKLENFIAGLGIPLIGSTVAKEIVKHYPAWTDFINAIGSDWTQFNGFGYEMNDALNNFDYTEAKEIAGMLTFQQPSTLDKVEKASAAALNVVITGTLSRKRDDIIADVISAGGKVASSVSSKTTHLVCNKEENTAKYKKAKELNIPIISEEDLMNLLK